MIQFLSFCPYVVIGGLLSSGFVKKLSDFRCLIGPGVLSATVDQGVTWSCGLQVVGVIGTSAQTGWFLVNSSSDTPFCSLYL